MEKDTTIETVERDPGLSTPEWIPLADLIERPAGRPAHHDQDIEAAGASHDHLRWRLVLLVGLRLTQVKYVAWLHQEQQVDAQYLAEEEAFLVCLVERVRRALAALRKTPE